MKTSNESSAVPSKCVCDTPSEEKICFLTSCRVVCAYSLFCNISIEARWIASESNLADAPSRQQGLDARATRAPGEDKLTTQTKVASPQTSVCAIATHSAGSQRDHWRPLFAGRHSCARSDFSELRQEHRGLHDMGTFEVASTRRLARLPLSRVFFQGYWADMGATLLSPTLELSSSVVTAFHANLRASARI